VGFAPRVRTQLRMDGARKGAKCAGWRYRACRIILAPRSHQGLTALSQGIGLLFSQLLGQVLGQLHGPLQLLSRLFQIVHCPLHLLQCLLEVCWQGIPGQHRPRLSRARRGKRSVQGQGIPAQVHSMIVQCPSLFKWKNTKFGSQEITTFFVLTNG
jgi:hypothetical protein